MKDEKDEEINKKIGEILTNTTFIETILEEVICSYFFNSSLQKISFFNESIIQPLTFDKKKIIFKQICKKEESFTKEVDKICSLIGEIQEIRNKAAHSETILNLSTGRKHLVKRIMSSQESLDLNDEFMKDFDKKVQSTLMGIAYLSRKWY